jgi:hypothetical protein
MLPMAEAAQEAFRRHQKVVAAVDQTELPAGTRGKVMYVSGFSWQRCRVRFDNGVERGSLDGRHLMSVEAWEAQEAEANRQRMRAEQQRVAAELRAQVIAARSSEGAVPAGDHG